MSLLVGLIIGAILGLTGAGGAAFALPLLILVVGLPVQQAIGLSLATVALGAGFGAVRRLQSGDVFWWAVICLSLGGMIAAPAGKLLATHVPDTWLLLGFTLLSIAIAAHMWRRCQEEIAMDAGADDPSASTYAGTSLGGVFNANGSVAARPDCLFQFAADGHFMPQFRSVSALAMSGLGVGSLSGLFGVGGGFLIVPLLHSLIGISMRQAIASSLLIITVISSTGFITHALISPTTDWHLLGQLAAGAMAGMYFASNFAERCSPTLLQKLFAVCLLLLAAFTLFKVAFLGV